VLNVVIGGLGSNEQPIGDPAEMMPGQHHARMNVYIAQAKNGVFNVVKSLGIIDPKKRMVGEKDAEKVLAA
jgi:hypothetical protein